MSLSACSSIFAPCHSVTFNIMNHAVMTINRRSRGQHVQRILQLPIGSVSMHRA